MCAPRSRRCTRYGPPPSGITPGRAGTGTAKSYVERFLGAGYALPGEATDLSVKLEPGLYGYGCFVETDEGVAHAEHGMISTFTVAG